MALLLARTASARLCWWRLIGRPWQRVDGPSPPYVALARRRRRWWQQLGAVLGWPVAGLAALAGGGWLAHRIVDVLVDASKREAAHDLLDRSGAQVVADLGGTGPLGRLLPVLLVTAVLAAVGTVRTVARREMRQPTESVPPRTLLRRHRTSTLLTVAPWALGVAAFGAVSGYLGYRVLPRTAPQWQAVGVTLEEPRLTPAQWWTSTVAAVAVIALGVGLRTHWGRFVVVRAGLVLARRLPWRTIGFLDDAVTSGELRVVGGGYQFRDPDRVRALLRGDVDQADLRSMPIVELAARRQLAAADLAWRQEVALGAAGARIGWARHRAEWAELSAGRHRSPMPRWVYRSTSSAFAWASAVEAAEPGVWSALAGWCDQVARTGRRWRLSRAVISPTVAQVARFAWLEAAIRGEPGALAALGDLVRRRDGDEPPVESFTGLAHLLGADLARHLDAGDATRRRWLDWRRPLGLSARFGITLQAWAVAIDTGEPASRSGAAVALIDLAETGKGRGLSDRLLRLLLFHTAVQVRIAAVTADEPDAAAGLAETVRRWRHTRHRWFGGRLSRWLLLLPAEALLARGAPEGAPSTRRPPAPERFAEQSLRALDTAAAEGPVVTCGRVFGALIRSDVYADWARIWPYDPRSSRLVEAVDTDVPDAGDAPTPQRWRATPVTPALADALGWADAVATRNGMDRVPPGLLALALVRDPRSGAARCLTAVQGVTREQVMSRIRQDLLRAVTLQE
ncbi:hypothetical protein ACLQ2S_22470 [Micromonospora sp. DT48]|uniref:hypothetical protein n=1 Tax=unclassified Micromonospora TaxID=2617518 RepID=UPI0012BBA9FF|nr:hypothetical protein [Micromonospora sp. CP22]MTK04591.1 hypothetical protein [Micromonospora sp. CP22]